MILSKIYANDSRFIPIIFNDGLNIIFGDEERKENDESSNQKTNEHGIGKTSLVYLIDFLLLKGVDKKGFFGKYKTQFADWTFFLEIKLNSGKYLTIRRSVVPNSRVSFKEHFSRNQDFSNETNWDEENLSINSKFPDKNPKNIFQDRYLGFDVNNNFSFRNFIPYLLRTQNDYHDVFRMTRYTRSHDIDWKPALFQLMGFNSNLLQEKYTKDEEIEIEKNFIKKIQGKSNKNELYKIKAAIDAKEIEKHELEKLINNFDFYKEEHQLNFNLVKNIEVQIAELNKENYVILHNIEQIRVSLDATNGPSLQLTELEKLFQEVNIYFPAEISKSYDDVLNFTSQITKEREKYLKTELDNLEEKQGVIISKLQELNKERTEILSLLKERDTFIKYRRFQEELTKIDSDIFTYKAKLEQANTVENLEKSMEDTIEIVKKLTISIKEELNKDSPDFLNLKKIYQDIYKKTLEYTALLIIEPNGNGNIDFDTTILNQTQDLTGKGDGYTSTKVLCASFILAIIIHYSSKSFFRFAYHDGVLEGWGRNPKIDFINLIREYCKEYNIQYIISLIRSDVPSGFTFHDTEVIRTLSKNNELFGFSF